VNAYFLLIFWKAISIFSVHVYFMKLKVILEEAEEGGYIVSFPALPGCHSQGDSIEDALENIKEAIAGCIESLAEERTRTLGSQEKIVEVVV
jgi:predicted RNase H-like HicB family nuclease